MCNISLRDHIREGILGKEKMKVEKPPMKCLWNMWQIAEAKTQRAWDQ